MHSITTKYFCYSNKFTYLFHLKETMNTRRRQKQQKKY